MSAMCCQLWEERRILGAGYLATELSSTRFFQIVIISNTVESDQARQRLPSSGHNMQVQAQVHQIQVCIAHKCAHPKDTQHKETSSSRSQVPGQRYIPIFLVMRKSRQEDCRSQLVQLGETGVEMRLCQKMVPCFAHGLRFKAEGKENVYNEVCTLWGGKWLVKG